MVLYYRGSLQMAAKGQTPKSVQATGGSRAFYSIRDHPRASTQNKTLHV